MSFYDYDVSRKLDRQDTPFDALIMGAMRKADTDNLEMLRRCWPHLWEELQSRYNAPGGKLPGEED